MPFPRDEVKLKEKYKTFLEQNPAWEALGFEYWLEQMGYKRENGGINYYANPKGKWDYYSLDGRDFMFDLKPGAEQNNDGYYRKNDYQYDGRRPDSSERKAAARFWEVYVEGKPLSDGEEKQDSIFTREYYLERYKTKNTYVKSNIMTYPYAFITPDGVWHSPGTVGWFGMDDATGDSLAKYQQEWENYIASEANPYVSFVDCHI